MIPGRLTSPPDGLRRHPAGVSHSVIGAPHSHAPAPLFGALRGAAVFTGQIT